MIQLKKFLFLTTSKQTFNLLSQHSAKTLCSLVIASSCLSLIVSGCTTAKSANPNTASVSDRTKQKTNVVRLGFQKGGVIPVSQQRGELARDLAAQNIKVEWAGPFDRCASLLQAVSSGKADIGGCGDIPSISAIAAKQPLCIGAVQPPRPNSLQEAILVRGDSSIRKPADLVGKKVAVNQGGAGEYLLLKVLEKENIPKDQVKRVYLGPTDALPALLQSSVDGWAVWEPYVSIAELEHKARRITKTHPAPTYGILLVRIEAATQNPTGVQAALTGLGKEAEWLGQHPSDSAAFMAKALKISSTVAEQATKNRGPELVVPPKPIDIANLQKTADWMLKQKIIPARVDIAAAVCPQS